MDKGKVIQWIFLTVVIIGGGYVVYAAFPLLISILSSALSLGLTLFVFFAVLYFIVKLIRR